MKNIDKFISLYKDYETSLRSQNIEPKEYEEQADEITSNRLKICRQMRNYISHQNDPGFLEPSDFQLKFLEKETKKIIMSDDIVKKHIKKNLICNETDKVYDVIHHMVKNKLDTIIMLTKDGTYKSCSLYDVVLINLTKNKTTKMIDVKSKIHKNFVEPFVKVNNLPEKNIFVVTDDGTKEGKYLGVIKT